MDKVCYLPQKVLILIVEKYIDIKYPILQITFSFK